MYFLGSLLTSPIETTHSIWRTFHALGYPRLGYVISTIPFLLITISAATLIAIFTLPIPAILLTIVSLTAVAGLWNMYALFIESYANNDANPKNSARNYKIEVVDKLPENAERGDNIIYINKNPEVILKDYSKGKANNIDCCQFACFRVEKLGREEVDVLPDDKEMEVGITYYKENKNTYNTKLKTYACTVKDKSIQLLNNVYYISKKLEEDPSGKILNYDEGVRLGDVIFVDTEASNLTPKDTTWLSWQGLKNGTFFKGIDHSTTLSIQPQEFNKIFSA